MRILNKLIIGLIAICLSTTIVSAKEYVASGDRYFAIRGISKVINTKKYTKKKNGCLYIKHEDLKKDADDYEGYFSFEVCGSYIIEEYEPSSL